MIQFYDIAGLFLHHTFSKCVKVVYKPLHFIFYLDNLAAFTITLEWAMYVRLLFGAGQVQ